MHDFSSRNVSRLFDIALVGAGAVGLASALWLAEAGFSVAVIEKNCEPSKDLKWWSLGYDVVKSLETLGIFPSHWCDTGYSQKVVLSYEGSPHSIVFSPEDLKEEGLCPIAPPYLALTVNSLQLIQALWKKLEIQQAAETIDLFRPSKIQHFQRGEGGWHLILDTGIALKAQFLWAADGASSILHHYQDAKLHRWTYPQKAASWSFPAQFSNVAFEEFFSEGSLALLPLGLQRGAAIWIGPPQCWQGEAHSVPSKILTQMEELVQKNGEKGAKREGGGAFSSSELFSHPLYQEPAWFDIKGQWASPLVFDGAAVFGDAAFVVHPIAGQGLNLGLRNAWEAVHFMGKRRAVGLVPWEDLQDLAHRWISRALWTQGLTHTMAMALKQKPLWNLVQPFLQSRAKQRRWLLQRLYMDAF